MKNENLEEFAQRFEVVIELPVVWGEMDSMQHVNHTVYLKWMEAARFSYFEKIDMQEQMKQTGIGNILKSIECRYRVPLTHPDTVSVGSRLESLEEHQYVLNQAVYSHQHKRVAAEGKATMVMYDYQKLQKIMIPLGLRERIIAVGR